MVLIKVQYDAYNRQFKLLDPQSARKLEDGETYVLIADVAAADAAPVEGTPADVEMEHVMA
jgi:hypothetical protein